MIRAVMQRWKRAAMRPFFMAMDGLYACNAGAVAGDAMDGLYACNAGAVGEQLQAMPWMTPVHSADPPQQSTKEQYGFDPGSNATL
ncbi:MAG: hypothetical protein BGP25_01180 [Lysobacterales bacterium 63-13]|nr:MAG: hypothetical protein BGP25_01180 [Xanthomonadales bacterium 63-13]